MNDQLISLLGSDSLDLSVIKDNLKTYLINEGTIKDIDYEGSNISILVNIISYAIYNINANNALRSSDSMLTTSTIRENIIAIAKQLSYEITRSISSKLNVTFSYAITSGQSITIPKQTKFNVGDFTFSIKEDVVLTEATNSMSVDLVEGIYVDKNVDNRLQFNIETTAKSLIIPYKNIENDNILVTFTRNGQTQVLTKTVSLLDLDSSNYYEEYDIDTGYVKLIFGYTNLGFELSYGDIVDIEILLTNGSLANGLVSCTQKDTIYDNSNNIVEIGILVNSASRNGQDEESNEDIQSNAPIFYNTGNRIVNSYDYKSFLAKDSLVKEANAWGFESLPTPYFEAGTSYFTVTPQDTTQKFLGSLDIVSLIDMLSKKRIISTYRKYQPPIYVYLDLDIKIIGNVYNLASKQALVAIKFEELYQTYLSKFDGYLYYSRIVRELENIFLEDNATIKITMKPYFILEASNFDYDFTNDVLVFIPDSERRRYLTKDGIKIDYPTDVYTASDLKINGWEEVFEPLESYTITFTHEDLTFDGINIEIDSTLVGVWDSANSMIIFDKTQQSLIQDKKIYINYSDLINVKYINNTFIKKGDITYV